MSKEKYVLVNGDDFSAIVWETSLGNVITVEGKLDIKNDLKIYDTYTGEMISNIDLREVLLSILPQKFESEEN